MLARTSVLAIVCILAVGVCSIGCGAKVVLDTGLSLGDESSGLTLTRGDGDPSSGDGDGDPSSGDGDGDGDGEGEGEDMSGTFLFALETPLGPDLPLQFATTITMTPNENGVGGVADFSFQPLSLDPGAVQEPQECVGEPLVYSDVEYDGEGEFELDMGEFMIPGSANPILGSDIALTMFLSGGFVHTDALCGTSTGELTSPLEGDLDGSVWAAIRLDDDGCNPDTLPMTFPYNCDMVPPPDAELPGLEPG